MSFVAAGSGDDDADDENEEWDAYSVAKHVSFID